MKSLGSCGGGECVQHYKDVSMQASERAENGVMVYSVVLWSEARLALILLPLPALSWFSIS